MRPLRTSYPDAVNDRDDRRPATIADLLAIPEDRRRHEILDGILVEKEAASGRHGGAQIRLARWVGPYDRGGGSSPGGWWFASEVEVALATSQVVRPGVAGWRRERLLALPAEVPVRVRPDWICEVLSTNRRRDLVTKKRAYHAHDVPHYWLVDPVDETLAVHRWHPDGYVEVLVAERTDVVRAEPFDALDLRVGVLFGDDD
jgi:Uma2 family endonuclease